MRLTISSRVMYTRRYITVTPSAFILYFYICYSKCLSYYIFIFFIHTIMYNITLLGSLIKSRKGPFAIIFCMLGVKESTRICHFQFLETFLSRACIILHDHVSCLT